MSVRSAIASTSRVLLRAANLAAPAVNAGRAVSASRPPLLLGPCTCTAGRLRSGQDSTTETKRLLSSTSSVRAGPQRSTKPGPPKELRDEAIRPKWVKVVVQNEDGSRGLGPLEPKDAVLRRMERYDTFLLQVDEQDMTDEEKAYTRDRRAYSVAICKYVNKKESSDAARAKRTAQKEKKRLTAVDEKEVQFTWGVGIADLGHKLGKAAEVLEGGGRIGIAISSPKGSKPPTSEEKNAFLTAVKAQLSEGGKAKEWKADEWRGARACTIYLQGIRAASTPDAPSNETSGSLGPGGAAGSGSGGSDVPGEAESEADLAEAKNERRRKREQERLAEKEADLQRRLQRKREIEQAALL